VEALEIEAIVRTKNQVTIPLAVAERHGVEDEFTVRIIRPSYAGALAGIFGTTEENVAYMRGEREAWD
jgi:hypothetical protein